MIELIIKPRETFSWEEFCTNHPKNSIAIDCYVPDIPLFQEVKSGGPRANFNHHEKVDRLATRCTSSQVFMAIQQGLFETFRKDGLPYARVYANDCDPDVSTAVWLLKNHEQIIDIRGSPLIETLVTINDYLDTTAGCYPINPDSEVLRKHDWVFEPYTIARISGKLFQMKYNEMSDIIDAVCDRINDYIIGKAKKLSINTNYQILGGGENWKLVKEIGWRARLKLISDGIKAFVTVQYQRADGKWVYSIGRQSKYISFPVTDIYAYLNSLEGLDIQHGWGGGDTIGGSSRIHGSKFSPLELEKIINEFEAQHKKISG